MLSKLHKKNRPFCVLLLLLTTATAWAETIDGVKYVKYDTTVKVYVEDTHDGVTVLTGSETNLGAADTGTWYVVNANISFSSNVTLYGDVHLILANGCTMTLNQMKMESENSLTIYGQSLDVNTAGTLRANFPSAGRIMVSDYTQHSGNVSITGGTSHSGICICGNSFTSGHGYVNIYGGKLEVENKNTSIHSYCGAIQAMRDINIIGGSVTAIVHSTNDKYCAIYSDAGNVNLGYTRSTDQIKATSYKVPSANTISCTQTLKNNASTNTYTGTIPAVAINGKTLVPSETAYDITYAMNSGTNNAVNPATYMTSSLRTCNVGGTEKTGLYIFDPTRTHYQFDGWYLDENFSGDPLPRVTCAQKDCSFLECSTGAQTLYAKWTFNGYSVTAINGLSGFYPYNNGQPVALGYTVTDTRGTVLTEGTDYTAVITNSSNEQVTDVIDRGTYTLTITGTGSYGGTLTSTFTVGDWNIVNLSTMEKNTNYVAQNGDVIVGTVEYDEQNRPNIKISIAAPAAGQPTTTVKLNNVIYDGCRWPYCAGITCLGDATLILEGTNVISGCNYYPAIQAGPAGTTLTIRGDGSMEANPGTDGNWGAGIGGGYKIDCGNIRIESGTIVAESRARAASIGGGPDASCGNITITDGVTQVTARKGVYAPYSIGAGENGTCGTITIGGKVMDNITKSPYVYKPNINYTIVFGKNADDATGSMDNMTLAYGEERTLTANAFERWECTLYRWSTQGNGTGTIYADGAPVCNLTETDGATVTLYAQWKERKYFVSFDLQGGYFNSSVSSFFYTARSAAFTLPTPYRKGYTFAGWTGPGLTAPTLTVEIEQGSTGNRAYTATWTPIVYDINLPQSLTATVGGQSATTATIGQTVTLSPKSGYSLLEAPQVIDGNAKTVTVTDNQDGTYSFTMPASNVTVTQLSVEPGWTFAGTYKTQDFDASNSYYYGYVGTAGTGTDVGTFVQVGGYVRVKPLRAYLVAPGGTPKAAPARRSGDAVPTTMKVRLLGTDGETTGILQVNGSGFMVHGSDAWYSIDGRKLQGEPTQRGIYINNGKKVVIK